MSTTIAACRDTIPVNPFAWARRVSWFRLRAMPLSWDMKSRCSRRRRSRTRPAAISWRRTSVRGRPAARANACKRSLCSVSRRRVMRYSCFRALLSGGRPPVCLGCFMDSIVRSLDQRDESRKASFWLTKTQTCLLTFSYLACVWEEYAVETALPAKTRSNPYAPDKGATDR